MRRIWTALALSAVSLMTQTVQAQGLVPVQRGRDDFRDEVQIGRLMDRLRQEMWDYRRDLEPFRGSPIYNQLLDLRYELRGDAIRVVELEDRGRMARRAQREAAQKMKRTADQLKRLTGRLEDRTDDAPRKRTERLGDRLKERANRIESMIDRLARLVRED